MQKTQRILRQVRRNNIAVMWDNFNERLYLYTIPKRQRSLFRKLRKNVTSMENAIKFMANPSLNPVTGLPLKEREGKKLFNK